MCTNSIVNADSVKYGLVTSKTYQTIDKNADCTMNIVSNDPFKAIKFYITDIAIKGPNNNEVLV